MNKRCMDCGYINSENNNWCSRCGIILKGKDKGKLDQRELLSAKDYKRILEL